MQEAKTYDNDQAKREITQADTDEPHIIENK